MRRPGWAALWLVVGWYLLTLAIAYPFANAPVVDSWIYAAAARWFAGTGEIRFAGYTSAMPVGQVVWGAGWGKLFGLSNVSLDLSIAALAVAGALMFHRLALRCGATAEGALLATALLIANPCWLFLSFSFMTEIPFLALFIAALLAFACAGDGGPHEIAWLSACAALVVGDFLMRPFAAAVASGAAAAILLYDFDPSAERAFDLRRLAKLLAPFALAVVACAAIWYWLTVLKPLPWDLQQREQQIHYIFWVPLGRYVLEGVLGPALTLGVALLPLALLQWRRERLRDGLAAALTVFGITAILLSLQPQSLQPSFTCFGGWTTVLQLRGPAGGPLAFHWDSGGRWLAIVLGSAGVAGVYLAAREVFPRLGRAGAAVMITAGLYWFATLPLWLFNDRYDLVLLPAGCLLLALAPPRTRWGVGAAAAMTLALGWVAIAGVYDYQRGIAAVLAARNDLLRHGVARHSIDAGYALNGEDLYRYPHRGIETMRLEAGIPMITSRTEDEYTITQVPSPGTRIVRRYRWPGPLGFGHREIYAVIRVRRPRAKPERASPKSPPSLVN
jgi:hypothetical protein